MYIAYKIHFHAHYLLFNSDIDLFYVEDIIILLYCYGYNGYIRRSDHKVTGGLMQIFIHNINKTYPFRYKIQFHFIFF